MPYDTKYEKRLETIFERAWEFEPLLLDEVGIVDQVYEVTRRERTFLEAKVITDRNWATFGPDAIHYWTRQNGALKLVRGNMQYVKPGAGVTFKRKHGRTTELHVAVIWNTDRFYAPLKPQHHVPIDGRPLYRMFWFDNGVKKQAWIGRDLQNLRTNLPIHLWPDAKFEILTGKNEWRPCDDPRLVV